MAALPQKLTVPSAAQVPDPMTLVDPATAAAKAGYVGCVEVPPVGTQTEKPAPFVGETHRPFAPVQMAQLSTAAPLRALQTGLGEFR